MSNINHARPRQARSKLVASIAVLSTSVAATLGGIFIGSSAYATATTLYVGGANCSNTGSGTASQPYCTIGKAATVATAGQDVVVSSGTYAETVTVANSGTPGSPITFEPAAGASVLVTGGADGFVVSGKSYVTVQGFAVSSTSSYGIYINNSNHIVVANNTVTHTGLPISGKIAAGIVLSGSTNVTVTGNTSDHNSDHGIYVNGTSSSNVVSGNEASFNAEGYQRNANGIDVTGTSNTIIGNAVHDNEDSGLQFYTGGNNNLITLNTTYNNGDHGIDDLNVTGGRIIGNTVYHNCTSGINVEGTSGNYTVENNVAVDNAVYPAYNGISCSRRAGNIGIWDSAPATTTVDNNLVFLSKSGTLYVFGSSYTSLAAMRTATGQEQHGVQANPNFANAAAGNLGLTEGSPAIDAANSDVSGEQPTDINGTPRSDDPLVSNTGSGTEAFDDIGAYEFSSQGAPQPPVAGLTMTPTTGTAPLAVTADASTSTDPQGQTLTYTFDFGDGTTVGPQAGATATHTYTTAGTYTAKVTVTNTSNLTNTAQTTVTANAAATQPPVAGLTITPTTGTAPLAVTADASTSTDPQGQTLTYTFDFGDGTTVGPQAGATATHTYTTAGTYTAKVTVTNTSNLTNTAQTTVTANAAATQPPVAGLTITPTTGTAPLAVTADASTSTDPQGQTLTYTFDFGDGTTVGPQAGATATHTYTTAGTYTAKVTVTNTSNLTNTAQTTVTANAATANPVFVSQIATNYSTSAHTSGTITVWRTQGVVAGDVEILTVQLTGTVSTGSFTGTDDSGNTLSIAKDVSDGSGDRFAVLYGIVHNALGVNDKITITFPGSAATYRIVGDEVAGISTVDKAVGATGTTSTYSSGATGTTSSPKEFVFSAVGIVGGSTPAWSGGWTTETTYSTSTNYVGRAYKISSSAGSFTASGTTSGRWIATCVTFQ